VNFAALSRERYATPVRYYQGMGDTARDAKIAACLASGGNLDLCTSLADGNYSDAAKAAGGQAAEGACAALGAPEAAPACGAVGKLAVGAILDAVSAIGGGGCTGPICDIPPPEETYPAAVARNQTATGFVPGILAGANYGGTDPNKQITGLRAGTLARALASACYIRIAAGLPLTLQVGVTTNTVISNKPVCPEGQVWVVTASGQHCVANPCDANHYWSTYDTKCLPGPSPQQKALQEAKAAQDALAMQQNFSAGLALRNKPAAMSTGKKAAIGITAVAVVGAAGFAGWRAYNGLSVWPF
jgi:hypothetical protein